MVSVGDVPWQGEGVAMLCTGAEVYGVAAVQRHLIEAWPHLEAISLGDGGQDGWLAANASRYTRMPGLGTWSADGSPFAVAASMPLALWRARSTARRLEPVLQRAGVRVLHVHWLPQVFVGGFLRRRGFRVVWHLHNDSAGGSTHGLRRRVNHRIAAWGVDHLLAVSQYVADYWSGAGPTVSVVHNGAPPAVHAQAAAPTPDGFTPRSTPFRCVIAGRLEADKGHHLAIAAVSAAAAQGHDIELDVFGGPVDSAYARALERAIDDAGVADRIRLHGQVDDLGDRLDSYHLGLQCRISPEPCSVWVAETQAAGLPLVASDNGGTPELVENNVTGVLVLPDSVNSLTAAIVALVTDRDRHAAMVAACRAAAPRYTLDRQLTQTAAIHQKLLDP